MPALPGDSCEDMSTRATEVLTGESIMCKDCEEQEDLQDVVLCNFLACLSNPGWNECVFEKHLQSLRPEAETLLPLVTDLETARKCEIVCVAMLAYDVRVADGTKICRLVKLLQKWLDIFCAGRIDCSNHSKSLLGK